MSRNKLKSEAGGGCKSSAESIGVHRSLSFRRVTDPARSPSLKMSRDELKSEAGSGCKTSAESIGAHESEF